jgi:hypothetical protein
MLTFLTLLAGNPQQGGGSFQLIFIVFFFLFLYLQYFILKTAIKNGIIEAKEHEKKQKNNEQ